jgi:hypothetical protein
MSTHNTKAQSKKAAKFSLKETGQISIFLGMSILVVTTFIAFVVNVGLFVKAKINLQNAVDASAYAGASVQARQLTNMGYLNWEMRNTYKEWLMKYYIFGNIGLDAIEDITGNEPPATGGCNGGIPLNPGNMMNFRLRQFKGSNCQYYDQDIFDRYNVPSVCIHFGSNNNICEIVTLPGLPRFNTVGLPSISEQHQTFLNNIVQTKADDCSDRSNINMGAAMLWTYGAPRASGDQLFPGIPAIASGRVGAWVQCLELALRMRNLEFFMNAPPQDFVCLDPSNASEPCTDISGLQQGISPIFERTVKAFYSGYRNLSGGASKEALNRNDFGVNFRMREIPPTPLDVNENSLSGFLIPSSSSGLQKHYVDLQAMPVNYSIFYTSFFPATGAFKATDASAPPAEGKCGGTKTALPVPGYIQGFVKSPEVMTYYAVEGKSEFIGLFYPFIDRDGITLKTYAAAKPFGGRIGPSLYKVAGDRIETRSSAQKATSSNYISAFDTGALTGLPFTEIITGGYPVPVDQDYWTSEISAVVGGNPTTTQPTFGIPNLIYDFESYGQISSLGIGGAQRVNVLKAATNDQLAYGVAGTEQEYGLYNKEQFRMFQANKVGGAGATFTNQEILESIVNVRRATRYEALNYLIPLMDPDGSNPLGIDQNSYIHPVNDSTSPIAALGPDFFQYEIYAPIIGPETLYTELAVVQSIIEGYINQNDEAVERFTESLQKLAKEMRNQSTDVGLYTSAANTIYPPNGVDVIVTAPPGDPQCDSLPMASKFAMFFNTSDSGCGIVPLARNVREFFVEERDSKPRWSSYYLAPYRAPNIPDLKSLMTGFMPGTRQGADTDGNIGSPFTGNQTHARRNSYSTKFFPIRSVLDGTKIGSGIPIFAEGNGGQTYQATSLFTSTGATMRNSISPSELSEYGADPKF